MATEVSAYARGAQPYSCVGFAVVTFPDGTSSGGTCALVGRNDILTATNVVYDPTKGGWAKGLQLFFGADYNSITGKFEDYGVSYTPATFNLWGWPAETFSDGNNATFTKSEVKSNIALIGVSDAIGDSLGWLGLNGGYNSTTSASAVGYTAISTGMMQQDVTATWNGLYSIYESEVQALGSSSFGGPLLVGNTVIGVSSGSQWWANVGTVGDTISKKLSENDSLLVSASTTETTAPTVTSFSPASGATGVNTTDNIVVTFSEPISRGSGSIVLKTTAGITVATYDAATSTNLTISSTSLMIDPTFDLAGGTGYKVEFAYGSIKDIVGNNYAGTTSYYFTTVATNAAPTLATPVSLAYTDTTSDDIFTSSSGVLVGSDKDSGTSLIYGISGGAITSGTSSKTGTYGTLNVNTSTGAYTFFPSDAAIEALKTSTSETFTVTVSDGSTTTGAALTVSLTGANDTTTFAGNTLGTVTEDGSTTATGTLIVSDRDTGDASVTVQTNAAGTYGTFNINTSGVWSYTLNNTATNVQGLKAGQTVTDSFTVTTSGGSAQTIKLSIVGAAENGEMIAVSPTKPGIYTGTSADDLIESGSLSDKITAGEGNNVVLAGEGNNVITAGAGNDQITCGSGADKITAGDGDNTIDAGAGNNTITTGSGNDTISSGPGNDKISAGAGNDRIDSGAGKDTISGGAGADTFVFSAAANVANLKTISDFTTDDTLELATSIFTKLAGATSSNFVSGTKAVDTNDYLIYDSKTGKLYYDADGSGSTAAIQIAGIKGTGAKTLSFDDFSFV